MKKNIDTTNGLGNYLYDISIKNIIFITTNENKVNNNAKLYKKYTIDIRDIENSKYYIGVYSYKQATVLNIIDSKTSKNIQFLINSREEFEDIEIDDLTNHVNKQIADFVVGYFE
ncbi:hypothetical protein [Olleya sp. HaHaR_3_96]|uniref:hypothetical protein n=1 Tax=Olleya sp. HaHaR_3_96 TaxID=2745560 RepID=UPI001C4FD68A|nr:hypothetical protein [Olleya sp. HaHaR_3_96]QXP60594.1 hypothetical protein H0I26_02820 [Olleya sp. HaHaR_3_96]